MAREVPAPNGRRFSLTRVMRMKQAMLVALAMTALPAFIGCEVTPETQAKVSATGKSLASAAYEVGKDFVINSAIERFGPKDKSNWLYSLAEGIRSTPKPADLTKQIAEIKDIWFPAAPDKVATELAKEFAASTAPPERKVEALAQGIERAALEAKKS